MKKYLLFSFLMITTSVSFSQNAEQVPLSGKWEKMMSKAYVSGSYKSFKTVDLDAFGKQIADSISFYQKKAIANESALAEQKTMAETAQKELIAAHKQLEEAKVGQETISYLGITANKHAYVTMLVLLLVFVGAVAAFMFFKYKQSHVITAQKIDDYEHLSTEFEEYKKGKIEMERKLKREMQTYINRLEELKR